MNGLTLPCEILIQDIDKLSYQDWLAVRRSGIGGSDVAAAIGLSPWKSPIELWEEKVLGKTQPKNDNDSMLWGRLLEPLIREEFSRRSGLAVQPLRSMLQHPVNKFMLANLDGLVLDPVRGPGVLEIKTASAFKTSEWDANRCPDAYQLQVQHYLEVTGLTYAVIVVLIGGNTLRWVTVEPDKELTDNLVQLEKRFWQHVLTQSPPPVDGSTACSEMLSRKYPASSNAAPLILPVDADSWIQDYLTSKAEEESAAERKRLAENKLKEVMKEHERATSPDGKQVTWKNFQTSRLDSARLKAEEPAVLERYTTTVTSRRFSVSMSK